ncbi:Choline transporter-like protein 1 [Cryptotermes secundus]|uniref:Choline transporter-like protein n=2 Tax=Cryptotermes secundus TaxID=105785 RepID=A0A2J7Q713_9NEOP|nr:choline transporter-like protein 1 [Cryptotermes secundus]XP_023716621.1 choline transporter-like protein 1 [Cryptotermes secundus]PNF24373.1 Choline transporter-like protein 1 [Cryptotermes secundus]PNF24374.1 Choline transporter-like protein 1 [Cryptotermes secundus]
MGSCCSGPDRVEPANERELDSISKGEGNEPEFQGPVKNRSCTDVFFFIIMLLFITSLVVLIIYCASNGDIYRIINGYDTCGNICGRYNAPVKEYDKLGVCIGEDMSQKKLLQISWTGQVTRTCVDMCSEQREQIFNRCIEKAGTGTDNTVSRTGFKNFFQEVSEDLEMSWREILYLCLIAFGFSLILLILFRYVVGILVWLVLIGVTLACIGGTVYLWILWKSKKDGLKDKEVNTDVASHLAYAIAATIVTVIVLLVILVMRKRIKLVIQLFKEAGRAINSMPLLLLEPLLTFVALGVVVAVWLVFSLVIESSGFFTPSNPASFEKNLTMKVTCWYNLLGLFWFVQFCMGCQHMIIAGAVAKWFFTRNKSNLGFPILRSFSNLVRYHLGTVAMGSLIIALVQLIRSILAAIQYQLKGQENAVSRCLFRTCQCCLYCFEKILKYLSRNAYIETALFGYSFCQAGQRAFKHLSSNALRVAAINSVGDFVLFLGKALVVIATVLIGIKMFDDKPGIRHVWVPLVLTGLFAYLVAHCFITVYEMAIDTIFICFCEDCEQNDGLNQPYYMSRGLMEFVQNSKKALAVLDASSMPPSQAWSTTSTRQAASGK